MDSNPRGRDAGRSVAVRLAPELLAALDAFAVSASRPGMAVSRGAALRVALIAGLEALKPLPGPAQHG